MGFKIRLITLDAGFYTVDVLNFISQFNYIIAVPVGDVKVYEDFDGEYTTKVRGIGKTSRSSSGSLCIARRR